MAIKPESFPRLNRPSPAGAPKRLEQGRYLDHYRPGVGGARARLVITMIVAIVSTKIPILLGHDFWIFNMPKTPATGFGAWSTKSARISPC